jgi:hypothetical protein
MLQSEGGPRHPLLIDLWDLSGNICSPPPLPSGASLPIHGGDVQHIPHTSLPACAAGGHRVLWQKNRQRPMPVLKLLMPPHASTELLEDLGHGNFPTPTRCWLPIPPAYASVFGGTGTAPTVPNTVGTTLLVHRRERRFGRRLGGIRQRGQRLPAGRRGDARSNPVQDADFLALTLRPRLGELLRVASASHQPHPGQEHCVSWWAKGSCNSHCSRRATHQPFTSLAERTRLLNHIRTHLVAAPTASTRPATDGEARGSSRAPATWHLLPTLATPGIEAQATPPRLGAGSPGSPHIPLPSAALSYPPQPSGNPASIPASTSAVPSAAELNLGKSALAAAGALSALGNWHKFIDSIRGPPDIHDQVGTLPHPAGRLLDHLQKHGAWVPLSNGPWSEPRRNQAIRRGPHKSAYDYVPFVCQEILDFQAQGYWTVLPYPAVCHLPHPTDLPSGRGAAARATPPSHRGLHLFGRPTTTPSDWRPGRRCNLVALSSVSSPPWCIATLNLDLPSLARLTFRMGSIASIGAEDVPKLGVAVPTTRGPPLIAFPLTLPMGWVESPPYFTSATETACDMASRASGPGNPPPRSIGLRRWPSPRHLSQVPRPNGPGLSQGTGHVRPPPMGACRHPLPVPSPASDVYVDDFLLVAQTKRQQSSVLRHTLQLIFDQVFRPPLGTTPRRAKNPSPPRSWPKGTPSGRTANASSAGTLTPLPKP